MPKQIAGPALAVSVRELLRHPGAHKHVALRAALPGLVTPTARVPADAPVTIDVEVASVVEGVLVTGQVGATAILQCARCLGETQQELRVPVQELFALDPAEAEEEGYAVSPDDWLVLDTMARDAIVLAFPAAPLCRPDCAGLCPVCGADRNAGPCGHEQPEIDPRWSALARWSSTQVRGD
jgi:uncharacterized protein